MVIIGVSVIRHVSNMFPIGVWVVDVVVTVTARVRFPSFCRLATGKAYDGPARMIVIKR